MLSWLFKLLRLGNTNLKTKYCMTSNIHIILNSTTMSLAASRALTKEAIGITTTLTILVSGYLWSTKATRYQMPYTRSTPIQKCRNLRTNFSCTTIQLLTGNGSSSSRQQRRLGTLQLLKTPKSWKDTMKRKTKRKLNRGRSSLSLLHMNASRSRNKRPSLKLWSKEVKTQSTLLCWQRSTKPRRLLS